MLNRESILGNETHRIPWDFEKRADFLISARRQDLVIISKKKANLPNRGLCCPGGPKSKIKESEREINTKTLLEDYCKTMEHEDDADTSCNWHIWNYSQRLGKETGKLGNKRKSGDNPENSIIKIGQDTKESPEDWGRLAVIQTAVKNHQLALL